MEGTRQHHQLQARGIRQGEPRLYKRLSTAFEGPCGRFTEQRKPSIFRGLHISGPHGSSSIHRCTYSPRPHDLLTSSSSVLRRPVIPRRDSDLDLVQNSKVYHKRAIRMCVLIFHSILLEFLTFHLFYLQWPISTSVVLISATTVIPDRNYVYGHVVVYNLFTCSRIMRKVHMRTETLP